MTITLGNLWIRLWQTSDIVLWIGTSALAMTLLSSAVLCSRHYLERKLSMRQTECILKLLILFLLFLMPVLTMAVLYKLTYVYVGPPLEGLEGASYTVHNYSVSYITRYGNHWLFLLLLSIWGVGFIYFGFISYFKETSILKKMKALSRQCRETELLKMKEDIQKEIGLKDSVPVYCCDMIDFPFMTGCLKPEIFLPKTEGDETHMILRHELIHCREKESLFRRMIFWLCAFYWFNPLMHKLSDYYIEVSEMSCDDAVLKNQTSQERYRYAELLARMTQGKGRIQYAASLNGYTKSQLEKRLENMMKGKKKISKFALAAIAGLLITVCPLTVVAASAGVSELQDVVVNNYLIEWHQETMVIAGNTLTEKTEKIDGIELLPAGEPIVKPTTMLVDQYISSSHSIGSVTVQANAEVRVDLKGTPETASFDAGYINSSEDATYVTSVSGEIHHEFTIPKAGTYTLFVRSGSGKRIYISGSFNTSP